ncbi:methionyl-tRNA formyltransferase, mitochondrial isoform X3 [Bacillus rossius redtenbacheri]|uniref:methionyl-tRNA formyltransferase, mitochondrial isoform X3 n=2 Tax=Bacillus rossius redtenbacheri TaxID=93214 RepID=UPI002FDD8CB4
MLLFFNKIFCVKCSGLIRYRVSCKRNIAYSSKPFSSRTAPWRILFYGSDDFSEASLKILYEELRTGIVSRLDVVTSLNSKRNPVRSFAMQHKLAIYGWPYSTIEEEYDVGVVVSFGHLIPERDIASFPLGMLNVHASLLPRWRGAAPIIHALMHGDAVTGVSIMRIKPNKFDIGDIVKQESCHIHRDETLPQLYGRLAALGAKVLVECLHDLPHCLTKAVPQPHGNSTYGYLNRKMTLLFGD